MMSLGLAWNAFAFEDPQAVLDRFLSHMKVELERLPDFVCSQDVERFTRAASERPWEKWTRFDLKWRRQAGKSYMPARALA
jgi:hypothetical protein